MRDASPCNAEPGIHPLLAESTTVLAEVIDETGATSQRPLDFSIAIFPFYWLPEDRLREREKEDGLPLSLYRDRGLLFTSPGATISADHVYRDISTKIAPQFPRLRTIGYDPAFAPDVAQRLSAAFDVREVPQNYNYMTSPCYLLEGLLKARRAMHAGHPRLASAALQRESRPVEPR